MWIFTDLGFFSVVEVDERQGAPWGVAEQGSRVLVRARSREQILSLMFEHRKLEEARVYQIDGADYPYRIVVEKEAWQSVMAALVDGITYHNFKNHVERDSPLWETRPAYVDKLHRVWATMASFGPWWTRGWWKDG